MEAIITETTTGPKRQQAACLVTYSDFGANTRARKQAEALLDCGFAVDCLVPRTDSNIQEWHLPKNLNLHFIPVYKRRSKRRLMYAWRYGWFFLLTLLTLTRLHFTRRYSYIQVATLPEFLCFTAVIPRLLGAKVVLDVCDLSSELYESKFQKTAEQSTARLVRLVEKLSLNFASSLITVHEPYRQKLLERGIKEHKIVTLLNVADHTVFQYQKPAHLPDQPARLVYHGTLARRNGVDIIVRAMAEIKKNQPTLKVRLDIYGDGDYYTEVARLTEQLGVSELVQIHRGFLAVNQLPGLLAGATAGLVANRRDGFMEHTLPTKLLEYVALGVPGIVARTSGIETYFNAQMVSFFEPEDHVELADRIVELVQHPANATEMAGQAYRFYDEHNWPVTRQRYLDLVTRLTAA